MVLLQRKLYFSKDPKGSNIFRVGGKGVQMLISVIFQGGPDPYLPS